MNQDEVKKVVEEIMPPKAKREYLKLIENEVANDAPSYFYNCGIDHCVNNLITSIPDKLWIVKNEEDIAEIIYDHVFGVGSDGDFGITGVQEAARALVKFMRGEK